MFRVEGSCGFEMRGNVGRGGLKDVVVAIAGTLKKNDASVFEALH